MVDSFLLRQIEVRAVRVVSSDRRDSGERPRAMGVDEVGRSKIEVVVYSINAFSSDLRIKLSRENWERGKTLGK